MKFLIGLCGAAALAGAVFADSCFCAGPEAVESAKEPFAKPVVCERKAGTGMKLEFPANADFSRELTVCAWVNFAELPTGDEAKELREMTVFARDWHWRVNLGKDRHLSALFTGKGPDGKLRQCPLAVDLPSLAADEWHHVAVSYSVSQTNACLFFDGKLCDLRHDDLTHAKGLVPLCGDGIPLSVGSLPGFWPLAGKVGRVRVYARALTADEILASERDAVKALLALYGAESGDLPLAEAVRRQRILRNARADRVLAKGKPLYWSVVDPMGIETFTPDSALPEEGIGRDLETAVALDEFEPASFVLRSVRDIPDFLPVVDEFRRKDGRTLPASVVDIRVVKAMVQAYGTPMRSLKPVALLHDDTLVKVDAEKMEDYIRLEFPDGARYVWATKPDPRPRANPYVDPREFPVRDTKDLRPTTLVQGESKQYWLTIRVPADAAPGLYRTKVRLVAGGRTLAAIPMKLRVLPFALPPPCARYDRTSEFYTLTYHRQYRRGNELFDEKDPGSISPRGRNAEQFRAEMRNLREHGVLRPTLVLEAQMPQWRWDARTQDPEGTGKPYELTADEDRYFRRVMQIMSEEGMRLKPFFFADGCNFGFRSSYRRVRHADGLKAVIRSMKRLVKSTLGHEDLWSYGVDEAMGQALTDEFEAWEDIRKEGVRVFTTARASEAELVAGRLDMLNCSGGGNRRVAKILHGKGARVITYAWPHAGLRKHEPHPYRLNYGFGLYTADYDGFGIYAYNEQAGNAWNNFDSGGSTEFAFILETMDGVVDTPSWEGLREAVDDVRYATLLQNRIAAAAEGTDPARRKLAESARRWLMGLDASASGFDPALTRLKIIGWLLKLGEEAGK